MDDHEPASTRERRHALRWLVYSFGSFLPVPLFMGGLIGWVVLSRPGSASNLSRSDWVALVAFAIGLIGSISLMRRRAHHHYAEMRSARNEQVIAAHRAAAAGDHAPLDAAKDRAMVMGLIPAILTMVGLGLAIWFVL
ncbi:MAG: hypothetical protein AAGA55_05530 [Planctomycetota bacterium]